MWNAQDFFFLNNLFLFPLKFLFSITCWRQTVIKKNKMTDLLDGRFIFLVHWWRWGQSKNNRLFWNWIRVILLNWIFSIVIIDKLVLNVDYVRQLKCWRLLDFWAPAEPFGNDLILIYIVFEVPGTGISGKHLVWSRDFLGHRNFECLNVANQLFYFH